MTSGSLGGWGWNWAGLDAAGLGATYASKVLSYSPIAYWPLWEASGTAAVCQVNALQNAIYSSNVSTWPVASGIGDGNTCPTFDGTNDYINAYTATLQGRFNGAEGGLCCWFKHAAGSHNDSTLRRIFFVQVDANNYIIVAKTGTDSNVQFDFDAGGTVEQGTLTLASLPTSYNFIGITWSKSNDRVRYYYNTTLLQTDTTLGTWAGAITAFYIGSTNVTPLHPYSGNLAHAALFNQSRAQR